MDIKTRIINNDNQKDIIVSSDLIDSIYEIIKKNIFRI